MTSSPLPLVFVFGDRAVSHAVDPERSPTELVDELSLYLDTVDGAPLRRAVVRSAEGRRPLDPGRPIGEQVAPDAEIELV